jgi:hypothetical protein
MYYGTKKQADSDAVPLQSAVLCVDCESVTHSRFDECVVCGSRSLVCLARILGGALPSHKANRSMKNESALLFNLEITIKLEQMEPKELNDAVEGITSLIGPGLVRGRACFHINVEPAPGCSNADMNTDEAEAA